MSLAKYMNSSLGRSNAVGGRKMLKNHDKEALYKKNPAVVCSELDGGAILLDLHTKYYYNLNETALKIWKYVNGLSIEAEIAERIVEEYEIDKESAEESVRKIMAELHKEGLIIT